MYYIEYMLDQYTHCMYTYIGDQTTSCCMHFADGYFPLCHTKQSSAKVARPSLCVMVMQYILSSIP